MAPAKSREPDQAQAIDVLISLGVIASKQYSGFAASGTMRQSLNISITQSQRLNTHLKERHADNQAPIEIVSMTVLLRQDDERDHQEDLEYERG